MRLNVFPIAIPPLRARKTDIPTLIDCCTNEKFKTLKIRRIPELAAGAIETLSNYQ